MSVSSSILGKPDLQALLKRHKTPFIMQMEAVECGAAALAIVLGYYGRFVPLAQLRIDCGVSRDGSKASNVLRAARKYGLNAKGFSKGLKNVREMPLPCIVFWEFNHFIVVEGFTEEFVYVNDPAHGHRRISHETFGDGFTGVVLAFEPNEKFVKEGALPNPFQLLSLHTRGSRSALVFIMICGLIGTVPGIAFAAITRLILDYVISQGYHDWLRPLLVSIVVLTLFQLSLTALSGLFYRRLQIGLSARLHGHFLHHCLHLPYQFYSQRYVGEVVSRSQLVGTIVSLISGQLTSTAVGLITMVLTGIVLFSYNPLLTGIGVASTVLNFLFVRAVMKRRIESNIVIAKDRGKLQGVTIATIQGIETIKASALEDGMYEKWAGYYAAASNKGLKLEMEGRLFSILPTITNTVVNTVTLLIGGLIVMNGEMTFGTLMAFNILMGQFLGPMNSVLGLAVQMQEIRGLVVRLHDVLEYPTREAESAAARAVTQIKQIAPVALIDPVSPAAVPTAVAEPNTATAPETVAKAKLDGLVDLSNLTYGYSPLGEPLVNDFSLRILPGQRVALVGRSGCGKSTIAKLAAGLLRPWSGEIRIDNELPDYLPPTLLVNSVSMIEQDIRFFAGTVRENLTLWDVTIPEQWVLDACEDAEILDTVLALPGGIDATVAEGGGNFSGGQRQRLEIARALVRQPSFLILDEATSALDTEIEAKIMANINRRGCACLIVAHRLSTIRNCHQVLVLEKGRVVESGTYEELLKRDGAFASLVKTTSKQDG